MPQIAVGPEGKELAKPKAVAHDRQVPPSEVLKTEALKLTANVSQRTVEQRLPTLTAGHQAGPVTPAGDEAKEARRQARLAILMRSNGIFSGDRNRPKDGLIYQEELRAE